VWNEAWITRPDLNDNKGSWNAYDGTCQEMSDGRCQMGPARVSAAMLASTSNKLTTEKFDAAFLSSETNCDKIDSFKSRDGKEKEVRASRAKRLCGGVEAEDVGRRSEPR
jgi:hypothetical protein